LHSIGPQLLITSGFLLEGINVSLTYLRGLEIPELNEEDIPMI